jgi:isopenicillin N synthase-like dioxygenase
MIPTDAASSNRCGIPSVDLKPFFQDKGVVVGDPPTEDQREVASTIHKACQEHGFVHVVNFGLTREMGDSLFEASREVFDNPNKHGDYEPWAPTHNTGYSPYRNESLNANRPADLKEAFNLRFPPTYDNPSLPRCPASLQDIVLRQDLFGLLRRIATRYGMACAVALDLPLDTFTKTLQTYDMCTVRFLHFPPCELPSTDGAAPGATDAISSKVPIRVGEHTDFGAYTVRRSVNTFMQLFSSRGFIVKSLDDDFDDDHVRFPCFLMARCDSVVIQFLLLPSCQGARGLQVKTVTGGEVGGTAGGEADGWRDVILPVIDDPSTFGAVINTGAMMARWTNDHWKATAHRVIVPTAEAASTDRYSIAFFVDPDADQLIEVDEKYAVNTAKNDHGAIQGNEYLPISSKDFIRMKLEEMARAAGQ